MPNSTQAAGQLNALDVSVGRRLALAMRLRGYSAARLAVCLGTSEEIIAKYCSGRERIGAAKLMAVASELRLSVSWFFTDTGEPQARTSA